MYFKTNENFEEIIKLALNTKNVICNPISTGWTNIVLDIIADNNSYIAKLPREEYWSKQIVRDSQVSNFVRENMSITTGNMKIYYNNNRPFSVHKKIDGEALTKKFSSLNNEDKKKISKQLAEIFHKFHSFNINSLPSYCQLKYSEWVLTMIEPNKDRYDMSFFTEMFNDVKIDKLVFTHNDLNLGNVILDNNNNISAIIDYSFAGLGDIYTDISVIACRTDDYFFSNLLAEYQKISNINLNMNKIKNRVALRKHIEDVYIQYMKEKHPEVIV